MPTTSARPSASTARSAAAKPAQNITLSDVGVRYVLLTEAQRTIKGRLLNLMGPAAPEARFWALQNINLTVGPGEVTGIVGRNGSGKSTLLRVMAGVIQPACGTVTVTGKVSPLLELGAAFNGELTGRENAYLYGALLGFSREQMDELIPQIIAFSELGTFFDIPIKTYSSGMVARLAFSVATQIQPEILLVDEVLAVGDEQFQKKSYLRIRKLIERGSIVVIVSHSSALVQQLCNRAVYLSKGGIVNTGRPHEVLAQYQRDAASNF